MEFKLEVRGLKEFQRELNDLERQVPFILSKGLNDLAKDVKDELTAQMPSYLDRPTPFTQRAIGVERATKKSLKARVYIKEIQAAYLWYQVEGGTRTDSGRGFGLPVNRKRNKFGNIPGRRKGLLKRNEFFATINGTPGVWKRLRGGKLKLMVALEKTTKYEKRFPFYKLANDRANRRWRHHLDNALKYALKTSR